MYLRYGGYTHATGECSINRTRTSEFNQGGQRWGILERWNIQGMLLNPTGSLSAMKTAEQALISAYASGGYDLVLCFENGNASAHAMYTASAVGGTKIIQPPSFPDNSGAAGVTYSNYTLAVEGFFLTGEASLLSFTESLSFSGGGPVYGHLETLRGRPVKQLRRRASIYKATQQGQAIGINAYPSIPRPIWPAHLMKVRSQERQSPRRDGNTYLEFPLTWRYEFESAYPLVGNPTRW